MPTNNTLTWTANPASEGVAQYNIYRKIGSAPAKVPGDKFASVPATLTQYVDTVSADGDYFYAVTAQDTAGNESGLSVVKDKVVDLVPPSPPTGLSVV